MGTLKGFDQTINLIWMTALREYSVLDKEWNKRFSDLYIVRGDNVAVLGEIDEDVEKRVNFSTIKAEPLNPIVFWWQLLTL